MHNNTECTKQFTLPKTQLAIGLSTTLFLISLLGIIFSFKRSTKNERLHFAAFIVVFFGGNIANILLNCEKQLPDFALASTLGLGLFQMLATCGHKCSKSSETIQGTPEEKRPLLKRRDNPLSPEASVSPC